MFVSDSNIFPSSKMKIRITCPDGSDFIAYFSPEATVDQLKVAALGQLFANPSGSMKESLYHKVVLVRNCKALEDDKTLINQGVIDNDEVLLLKRRLCPSQFDKADRTKMEEAKKGPTAEEITKATAVVTPSEIPEQSTANVTTAVDFQTELRKILISLIEVSQKLLCLNPEASKVFQQAEEILNEPSTAAQASEEDIKQLIDMGFPETRARKALLLNKSVMSAMEWLLQQADNPEIDTPLPESPEPSDEDKGAVGGTPANDKTDNQSTQCRVSNILHSLRAYKKREFRPNQKTLQHLMEMGFEESSVVEALRATRNDGDAACELLLCNKKPPPEDIDDGIEFDSPLFRAILANPTVQLGLNNPRCLLAFLQMLEHPQSASTWLSDPETAPLLVQVSRIYHAEKNSEMQQNYEAGKTKDKTTR